MRVLLVSEYYPPRVYGGGEIGAQILAETLAKEGINVTVLTSSIPEKKSEETENNVRVLRVLKTGSPKTIVGNIRRRLVFTRSVRKNIIKRDTLEAFDIIHFLNNTSIVDLGERNKKTVATLNSYQALCPKANLFYKEKGPCTGCTPGKYVGCITRSRYVGRVRLMWYLKYNPLFWLWNYRSYVSRRERLRRVARKIVFNTYTHDLLARHKVTGIDILPNFTSSPDRPVEKKQHNDFTVTFIGNLEKMKGVHLVLQAFAAMKEKGEKNIRFLFAGTGEYAGFIRALSAHHPEIVFKGAVAHDAIQEVYAKTDVIVIPSLWPEPFSRVLLEAYYYAKPVIATAVGGNKEHVLDGKTGYLIEPTKGAEELVKKILVLKNKKLRDEMGKKAQAFYHTTCSPEVAVKKILKTYQGVVQNDQKA